MDSSDTFGMFVYIITMLGFPLFIPIGFSLYWEGTTEALGFFYIIGGLSLMITGAVLGFIFIIAMSGGYLVMEFTKWLEIKQLNYEYISNNVKNIFHSNS